MGTNVSTDDFESGFATVAFVDLAGFSAITDVYGDASAIAVLGCFEELVRQALGGLGPPIKWIGDEAMFGFPDSGNRPSGAWTSASGLPIRATDSADKDWA
jgi:GGDEF domain-containing protein